VSQGGALAEQLRAGDRSTLARAITLVESSLPEHVAQAQALLRALGPGRDGALRLGVSGPPGVGKSTFLDAFGLFLLDRGLKVAVLAVDPSSTVSGGSILGDKARMNRLAQDPRAFIRPSPSGAALGGVTRRTRESIVLCEAAGFDVTIVETVGVGQSETAVADMVDCFLVLFQPGSGDELQGIKRGILELADIVAVNKADGDQLPRARAAVQELSSALRLLGPRSSGWEGRVLAISSLESTGLDALWQGVEEHRRFMEARGAFERRRQEQRVRWMAALIEEGLKTAFEQQPRVQARRAALEQEVAAGRLPPAQAAEELLRLSRGE
jgi:LAO/AO transport system kinase